MTILNMVGGGSGGGGGGGYKTLTQLKAMTLADAITELNTDAQGYYDNLNGNGYIIGIGIANDDKTTYQCRGVSPIIYWNGTWRNGEIIIVKIKAKSDGSLLIPISGYTNAGDQSASYNWLVSYDGGSETQYSGTGSGSITIATGLTGGSEHTVVIRPNSESYEWARAFGFYYSGVSPYLTEIVYDGSYMGYASTSSNTSNFFRSSQYRECTSLVIAPIEVLPDTVTSIGNGFRTTQYYGCTSLTTAPQEVLPSSVITVGDYFRNNQYLACTKLTTVSQEILPNSVTSIGTYFRGGQYNQCTKITTASQEVLPSSVTSIGNYFRNKQYNGCTSLTIASQEILPSSVTSIGTYFRDSQYYGCTKLTTASQEVFPNTITSIGNYFRNSQYYGCTILTTASQEILPSSVTSIGTYFRNNQYYGCTSLTIASQEVLPNTITSIGNYFRRGQYRGCTSLTTAPQEVLPSSVTSIGTYFRREQYYGCTSLTEILGWVDLSRGGSNYRYNQFYDTANKKIMVLSNVGYAGQSNTLSDATVTVVLVPSAYLSNFTGSTKQPRSSITDSKFVGY